MTTQELQAAKAKLNELDTSARDLRVSVEDGIASARAMNAAVRDHQMKLRKVEVDANALRAAINKAEAEAAAKLKVEAAKAKADAEKKAAEAKAAETAAAGA